MKDNELFTSPRHTAHHIQYQYWISWLCVVIVGTFECHFTLYRRVFIIIKEKVRKKVFKWRGGNINTHVNTPRD